MGRDEIKLFIISSRIFENIPQNWPEYPNRNLAIARCLVTAVRINIEGLPPWLVIYLPSLVRKQPNGSYV